MKYVMFYECAPDFMTIAMQHFPAHQARWGEFAAQGTLLMIGPFTDTAKDGAMGVFTTREAAEAFATGDPFVINRAVSTWRILEWNEALVPETGAAAQEG